MPPEPIRHLRDLTRYRSTLSAELGREAQLLEKELEDAGIKLSAMAPDILGVSGRAMLDALIDGERDVHALPAGQGPYAAQDPRPGRGAQGVGLRGDPAQGSRGTPPRRWKEHLLAYGHPAAQIICRDRASGAPPVGYARSV